ncbi:hypothetical protein TBLA_0C05990 [Henningerozyma blattae CBS 6284]|uniref:Cytochrome b mRNA-processing protein 4 n=1 Tax=Henningerozyma blattae (strain ATCC 34711 / CBS 6284 / DSM 70876 / NBRC 10599 / NRRL Y-10934 / UCD 77-7) TaxID=1071380 RepID=I2H1Z4_HENB6|nr:hypothetical protein TBLA_0C05990 [Tetrapisispora blattae CBS 6284]CCH60396.1 hypothetical protein TBLA_0C05990 [Tetrapisispora blattae CBS 6284]
MQRSVLMRWMKVYAYGGAVIATGVLLFKYTTPTDQQLLDSFSPENRALYEKNKKLRHLEQQELIDMARTSTQRNDPIWKTGAIPSPLERNRNEPLNNDVFNIQARLETENQQKIIKNAKDELQQIRKLEEQKNNNSWWKFW